MTDIIEVAKWMESPAKERVTWWDSVLQTFVTPGAAGDVRAIAQAEFCIRVNNILPPLFGFVVHTAPDEVHIGVVRGGRFLHVSTPSDFVRLAQAIALATNLQETQKGAAQPQEAT